MNFWGSNNNGFWLALSVAACLVILWAAFFSGPGKVLSQNPSNTTTDPNLRRLFLTAGLGTAEDVDTLLRNSGFDINVRNAHGDTLLGHALTMSRAKENPTLYGTVVMLLSHGANPNQANNSGWTAMHAAAYLDNEAVMTALIQAGGDPLIDSDGRSTPYEIALTQGNLGVVAAVERSVTYRPPDIEELKEVGTFSRTLRAGLARATTVDERKSAIRAAAAALFKDDEAQAESLYQEVLDRVQSEGTGFLGDCDSCEGE